MEWASLIAQPVKGLPVMQETQVRFLGWEDPLEQEMAIHSSILAWRILCTEEPGRLQSVGSQGSGMTESCAHTYTHTQSGIQENDRWTHLQGRNRDADIENGLVETAAGEGEAGTDWDSSITQVHYNWSTRQLVGSCCIAQGTQILGVL